MTYGRKSRAALGPIAVRAAALLLAGVIMAGCNVLTRLAEVGQEPVMTEIQNPTARPGYEPVSLPMPRPVMVERHPNSLWRRGARAFFKDQRAGEIGDLLTVVIAIADTAVFNNSTNRSRTNAEDATAGAFLGYEAAINRILPESVDPTNLVDLDSTTNSQGAGTINRSETLNVRVAALVTQVLPNGNLAISGRQEVRVNFELRELTISGVIRREDITSTNTIQYDQIAEARIAYGGRGTITDVQQPRYGQQIYDILFPF